MNLLLVRHGKAEAHGHPQGDGARALTAKGQMQSRKVGRFLCREELVPDLVLSSPLVRARETAELLCEEAGGGSPVIEEWLSCGMRPEEALGELAAYQGRLDTVALVGHEPDFSGLVGHVLGAEAGYVRVKKASVILLSVDPPRRSGVLQFSLWPSHLPELD
jgi:phosphohistidine phosphatase